MCAPIEKIRNMSAMELLAYCNQENSIPVDLKAILEKIGISALKKDFSNTDILGALAIKKNNAAIFYNQNDAKDGHRYRFTIAHELAHCCLAHYDDSKDDVHYQYRTTGKELDATEIAANIFAGELLIPKKALEEVISKLLLPSVEVLADIFAVSDNVMLARLDHLFNSGSLNFYKNIILSPRDNLLANINT